MNVITKSMTVDVAALVEIAARSEKDAAKRFGYVYQQPCKALSTFDERTGLLTLRNASGDLATYRFDVKNNRLPGIEVQS